MPGVARRGRVWFLGGKEFFEAWCGQARRGSVGCGEVR
jgi:hypothetical protein